MLDPGAEAPVFELPNQDGDPVALADYAGQHVVVYFYPRADTPGCTAEAEHEVAVVGISDDPVDDLAAFAAEYDLPIQPLSDEDGSVAAAYDSYGTKNVFGNEVEGVFRN
jgi:peroxiredoxin Q/BCP